jgi:hypothetical protein
MAGAFQNIVNPSRRCGTAFSDVLGLRGERRAWLTPHVRWTKTPFGQDDWSRDIARRLD